MDERIGFGRYQSCGDHPLYILRHLTNLPRLKVLTQLRSGELMDETVGYHLG